MKYIIFLLVSLALPSTFAADRCEGKAPKKLLEQEMVQNMYFDIGVHQVICELAGTDEQHKLATEKQVAVRTKYRECIIAAQDALVEKLGGEGPLESFYAAVGNQISLLNLPNPCGRVVKLADKMLSRNWSCRKGIVSAYKNSFAELVASYEKISNGMLFRRICDY